MSRVWAAAVAAGLIIAGDRAFAQTSVVVDEVGLSGIYRPDLFTRVLLSVSHTGAPLNATVRVVAEAGDAEHRPPFFQASDRVVQRIRLSPGTTRLELPIRLTQRAVHFIRAEVAGEDGGVLDDSQVPLKNPTTESLFVLICQAANTCERLQTEITFAHSPGFDAARETPPAFHRLPADRVPADWWALLAANMVVIAADVQQLSVSAATTVEGYLRHHGRVLLIEPGGGPAWLAPYRAGEPNGRPVHVGAGLMFRVSSDTRIVLGPIVRTGLRGDQQGLPLVAPALQFKLRGFTLPSFSAASGYLAAYVLSVGLLNFAILRRLRRVELGWVTVPLIALAFSLGAYAFGNARRPDRHQLDEVRVLWRDDRSPMAAVDAVARIAASDGGRLELSAADLLVVQATPGGPTHAGAFFIGDGLRRDLLDVERADGREIVPLAMVRWSFRDLTLAGLEQTTGTVRAVDAEHLRNDTSVAFEDSCFLVGKTLTATGALPAGGVVDLARAQKIERDARSIVGVPVRESGTRCLLSGVVPDPLPDRQSGAFIGLQAGAPGRLTLNTQDVDARASVVHVIYMPLAR